MLLFVAAAVASASPQTPSNNPVGASVQARATIRIISGEVLHFGAERAAEGLLPRDTIIRSAGGDQPAKLIEFQ